ncbi:fatty acid desaturase [Novosphingobium flavum]|uniref:Fatty acid desaturase n=1 Tax=Novosphingobium flavum TaxID=1778672 RepID=A0A7X1FNI2_9SPHN|nr:fatty acid desaturase [Novosphingobium flavum]MBC2664029.1 fatty acid desaturase [Novosphingobium flavum]
MAYRPVRKELSPAPPALSRWWERAEVPTWLVFAAIYGGWILLIVNANRIPWPLFSLAGAWLVTWHFSLQHEAIHGWLSLPRWLRHALVWPPIGGWLPFELYRRSHSQHHRDVDLTYPGFDTESVYHKPEDWARYSPAWRAVLMFNQTLLGRLLIGPLLRLRKLVLIEGGMLVRGDFRNLGIWLRFFAGLAVVLWFVSGVGHVPVWKYYLLVVYPGFSLGLLRAFIEHRWGEHPEERVAIVESNWVFGLLFLWNNIHVVHHLHPSLPWFRIPAAWRGARAELLALNGHYRFAGYGEIARAWLLRPVFVPVHPEPRPEQGA